MSLFGTGPAKALEPNAFARVAKDLKCHPADMEAIARVESAGFGWFNDGRVKILCEKHIFYRHLPKEKRAEALRLGLAKRKFSRSNYKDQKTPSQRYSLWQRMIEFHKAAAYMSVSVGTYQIMLFNHKIVGFSSGEQMFNAFLQGEQEQLDAFVAFLRNKRLVVAIRKRDFNRVEKRYNGGGLKGVYARRMRQESEKLRRGKWKNWDPSETIPEPNRPIPPPAPRPEPPKQAQDGDKGPSTGEGMTNGEKGGLGAAVGTTLLGGVAAWLGENAIYLIGGLGLAVAICVILVLMKGKKDD